MALQKGTVRVPLGKMDANADHGLAPLGTVTSAINCHRSRLGLHTPRVGTTALTTTTNRSAFGTAIKLATRGRELVQLAGNRLWSYSPADDVWMDISHAVGVAPVGGNISYQSAAVVTHSLSQIIQVDSKDFRNGDVAYLSGYYCAAFEEVNAGGATPSTLSYTIRDATTGAIIYASNHVNGSRPRVVASTTAAAFFVFYADETANTVKVIKIDVATPTTPNITATVNAATVYATNRNFDVQVRHNNNGRIMVCYTRSATQSRIVEWNATTNASAIDSGDLNLQSDLAISFLEHVTSGQHVIAASDASAGINVYDINDTTLAINATKVISAAVTTARNVTGWVESNNSKRTVLYEVPAGSGVTWDSVVNRATFSGSLGPAVLHGAFLENCGLWSRAFAVGSTFYVVCSYGSPLQSTYFVVDATESNGSTSPAGASNERQGYNSGIMNRILYGLGGGLTATPSSLCNVTVPASGKYTFAVQRQVEITAKSGVLGEPSTFRSTNGIALALLDTADAQLGKPLDVNGTLLIPGGSPRAYTGGQNFSEAGFHLHPEKLTLALAAGVNLTASARYSYVQVFRYIDPNTGTLLRSAVSEPATITTTPGNQAVVLSGGVTGLAVTSRLFRHAFTIATYLGGITPVVVLVETYRTKGNDTVYRKITAASGGTDTATDASLDAAEQLYITGIPAPLENFPPPPCRAFWLSQNRVWCPNSEDPRQVWYSKEIRDGVEVAFHPDLSIRADEPITSGCDMDGVTVLFSENSVYVVSGEGPGDTGAPNFPLPLKVGVIAGTVIPDSIVFIPKGLIFRSAKGFYLLTRGRQLEFIGYPVMPHNSWTVTGAVIDDNAHQVVWTTTGVGNHFVYDWFFDEWFFRTYPSSTNLVGAVLWGGLYTQVNSVGAVLKENPGVYSDDGASYTVTLQTGHWSLADLFSYHRTWNIRHLIRPFSAGTITMTARLNYESAAAFSKSFVYGTPAPAFYEVPPTRQEFDAIRLTFTVTSSVGACDLGDVVFEIGHQGPRLRPVATALRAT